MIEICKETIANTDEFLTEKDLADYLSFSPRTIRRWRRAGYLPAVRLPSGRGFRFRMSSIEETLRTWEEGF